MNKSAVADAKYRELKKLISERNISLRGFIWEYYRCCINKDAEEVDLQRFYDLMRKEKSKKHKNIERISPMLNYAQQKYSHPVGCSGEAINGHVAWVWLVELRTRITSPVCSLDDGCPQAALRSIHSLFPKFREIVGGDKGGQAFYSAVEPFYNGPLRQFCTRWHVRVETSLSDEEKRVFEIELKELQQTVANHCEELEQTFLAV